MAYVGLNPLPLLNMIDERLAVLLKSPISDGAPDPGKEPKHVENVMLLEEHVRCHLVRHQQVVDVSSRVLLARRAQAVFHQGGPVQLIRI